MWSLQKKSCFRVLYWLVRLQSLCHTVCSGPADAAVVYPSSLSCWRLWPSRRQIKTRVAQQLIFGDIHRICRERGREHASVCYHVVAMALRVWKESRVSMTLPQRLQWLGETIQAFFFLFKFFSLSFCPSLPLFFCSDHRDCPVFSLLFLFYQIVQAPLLLSSTPPLLLSENYLGSVKSFLCSD